MCWASGLLIMITLSIYTFIGFGPNPQCADCFVVGVVRATCGIAIIGGLSVGDSIKLGEVLFAVGVVGKINVLC